MRQKRDAQKKSDTLDSTASCQLSQRTVKLKQAAAGDCERSPERPEEVKGLVGEGAQQGGHV
jgi:hypothetical protein